MKSLNPIPAMRQWYEDHIVKPAADASWKKLVKDVDAREKNAAGRVIEKTPATELDKRAIVALFPGYVTYPVGSPQKRFARDMQGATELTHKQRAWIWAMVWTYRRQIGDRELVKIAKEVREKAGA